MPVSVRIGAGLLFRAKPLGAAIVGFCLLALPLPGAAQTALEDSIANRTRPNADPIGMVVGPNDSFLLFPQYEQGFEIVDNLFATETNITGDATFLFKPSFDIRSDWDSHSLVLSAKAEQGKFVDNTDENYLDYGFGVSGRLDALEQSNLTAAFTLDKDHQERGDPNDDVLGVVETEVSDFTTAGVKLGALYNEDVILVRLDIKAERVDFNDAGTTNNDDRDVITMETRGRLGYEWVPGSTAFVEMAYDLRHFDTSVDDQGFKRSSRGFEILLGNTLDLSGVTFVELGLGFVRQTFGSQPTGIPNIGPTQGFSFKGSLVWNPTDLVTITGNLRRVVNETTIPGAASAFTSTFGLTADYGPTEELLLSAGANFNLESFDGIGRLDKLLTLDVGAKYFIGPYFIAEAGYEYEERFADDPGSSFANNTVTVSLTARF